MIKGFNFNIVASFSSVTAAPGQTLISLIQHKPFGLIRRAMALPDRVIGRVIGGFEHVALREYVIAFG